MASHYIINIFIIRAATELSGYLSTHLVTSQSTRFTNHPTVAALIVINTITGGSEDWYNRPGIPANHSPGIPVDHRPGIPANHRPGIPANHSPGIPVDHRPGICANHLSRLTSFWSLEVMFLNRLTAGSGTAAAGMPDDELPLARCADSLDRCDVIRR